MTKKRKITEDDANTLNFGIPLVLTLFLFIVNGIIFSTFYAESMLELFKINLFFIFIVLLFDLINAKRKKEVKTVIQLNAYKNLVLSASFVLFFLGLNFIGAETIFETKMFCDKKYDTTLKKYSIPPEFNKFYRVDREEIRTFFNKDNYLHIKIAKSIFGYKILEKRTFEKVN